MSSSITQSKKVIEKNARKKLYYEKLHKTRGYYKLIRNIRYKNRITITAGINVAGFILGKSKKNIIPYKIKYQNKEGNKVIIIIGDVYDKCRDPKHICNNNNVTGCIKCRKYKILIEKAMLLKEKLNNKYKRICKYKKIKGIDKIKEENMYNFEYDEKYKLLFDYYIHPDHVPYIIGKEGTIIKLLNSKFNCNIHIHRNKNKS